MIIAITRDDGGVSIMTTVAETPKDIQKEVDKWQEVNPAQAVSWREICVADIPSSRAYREAWHDSNPEEFIGVNMDKALAIAHSRRRIKRDADFKPHDDIVAMQIPGSDIAAAHAARDLIRDSDAGTQIELDECLTPEELESKEKEHGIL